MTEDEERLRVAQAYLNTFISESGEIVLKDMKVSYNDRESFVPLDPFATAFAEGQRSVYLSILRMMEEAVSERTPQTGGKES